MSETTIKVDVQREVRTTQAIHRVVTERIRQINREGYTPRHDSHHHQGELARAAACYAMPRGFRRLAVDGVTPLGWPWSRHSWKPTNTTENQTAEARLRELEKAGALILAEMERLIALGEG